MILMGWFIGMWWQGTDCRVAAGEIVPEKQYSGEDVGIGKWDVCESEHGWSSIFEEDWSQVLQKLLWSPQGLREHVQVQHR